MTEGNKGRQIKTLKYISVWFRLFRKNGFLVIYRSTLCGTVS